MAVEDLNFVGIASEAPPHSSISRFGMRALAAPRQRIEDKRFQLALKRLFDIVVSVSAIIALLPLLVAITLIVRLTSAGPAIFTQVRWGKDCRKIRVYKFRSMYTDLGDSSGVAQTQQHDSRITPIGAILRKTNIDELPQLFNVLKGDMSLVGPRPHAIGMFAAGMTYEELVPAYHARHRVRPGMTGLAQMRGLRGPTVLASKSRARVAADLHYVENFSILLDMKIIYGTLRSEAFGGSGF